MSDIIKKLNKQFEEDKISDNKLKIDIENRNKENKELQSTIYSKLKELLLPLDNSNVGGYNLHISVLDDKHSQIQIVTDGFGICASILRLQVDIRHNEVVLDFVGQLNNTPWPKNSSLLHLKYAELESIIISHLHSFLRWCKLMSNS